MSFMEYLISHGYSKEDSNNICILIENELSLPEKEEELYWEWWNKEIIGR